MQSKKKKKYVANQTTKCYGTFILILLNISSKLSELFPKSLGTFPKNSRNFFQNLSEHFQKTLGTFILNFKSIFGVPTFAFLEL